MTRPPVVVDDVVDAMSYAMQAMSEFKAVIDIETGVRVGMDYAKCPVSPTDRAMAAQMAGKSIVQQQWMKQLEAELNKPSMLQTILNGDGPIFRRVDDFNVMRAALKALKSDRLQAWNQMSRAQRKAFIARIKRSPNAVHLRDIHAAFIAEQVFRELKD